jgi:hypothetical protein
MREEPLFPCAYESSARFIGNFDGMSFYLSCNGKTMYRCCGEADPDIDGHLPISSISGVFTRHSESYKKAYEVLKDLLVLL